jgi:hypothetical protein
MIGTAMARKVLGAAANACSAAVSVARHVVWYVSYRVDGRARESRRD